jgi:hypothetical protein
MAVFVVRSVMGGDNFTYSSTPYFSDMPASNLYFPWVQKMKDLGIALPCGPKLLYPAIRARFESHPKTGCRAANSERIRLAGLSHAGRL